MLAAYGSSCNSRLIPNEKEIVLQFAASSGGQLKGTLSVFHISMAYSPYCRYVFFSVSLSLQLGPITDFVLLTEIAENVT